MSIKEEVLKEITKEWFTDLAPSKEYLKKFPYIYKIDTVIKQQIEQAIDLTLRKQQEEILQKIEKLRPIVNGIKENFILWEDLKKEIEK